MTSLPAPDDSRSQPAATEPVPWRKSRHSAAAKAAACVEATLAVRRSDGSIAVENPGRAPIVLVQAPSVHLAEEQAAHPPTESVTPWTRGSLDESVNPADLGTRPAGPLETEHETQLGDTHGLPGFGSQSAHRPPATEHQPVQEPRRLGAAPRSPNSGQQAVNTGGHGGIQLRANREVLDKETNDVEVGFYRRLRDPLNQDDPLRPVVPGSHTAAEVQTRERQQWEQARDRHDQAQEQIRQAREDGREPDPALERVSDPGPGPEQLDEATLATLDDSRIYIDNITAGMVRPQLLDVKIGSRTASRHELMRSKSDFDAWVKKMKLKVADYITGSRERGYRVVGGSGLDGGRRELGRNSDAIVRDYVDDDPVRNLAATLRDKIMEVENAVQASPHAFIAASVLMAVDRDSFGDDSVRVNLIDFAHAFTETSPGMDHAQYVKYSDDFRQGIRNLSTFLNQIATGRVRPEDVINEEAEQPEGSSAPRSPQVLDEHDDLHVPTTSLESEPPAAVGHEPQLEGGRPATVSEDPAFAAARQATEPVRREHSWVDPVSLVMDSEGKIQLEHDEHGNVVNDRFGRPVPQRFAVHSDFDVRRFEVNGQKYTDLTVKVRADGTTLSHDELAGMWDTVQEGIDRFYNEPSLLLSSSDTRLHVTVEQVGPGERVDPKLAQPMTISRADSSREMNQFSWFPGATPVEVAHEIGHQLGVRDEYKGKPGSGIEHRPNITGSLFGDFLRPIDGTLPRVESDPELMFQGMRDRYLRLVDRIIGELPETRETAPGAQDHGPGQQHEPESGQQHEPPELTQTAAPHSPSSADGTVTVMPWEAHYPDVQHTDAELDPVTGRSRFFVSQTTREMANGEDTWVTDPTTRTPNLELRAEVPLKFSRDLELAVEDSYGRQAKVFFATQEHVDRANDRLGGRVQLRPTGGHLLMNRAGQTIRLERVEPVVPARNQAGLDVRTPQRCNEMATFATGIHGLDGSSLWTNGVARVLDRVAPTGSFRRSRMEELQRRFDRASSSGRTADRDRYLQYGYDLSDEYQRMQRDDAARLNAGLAALGMNEWMRPRVGDAMAIVGYGNAAQSEARRQDTSAWDYHFGSAMAVDSSTAVAHDGSTYVTMENFARHDPQIGNSTASSGDPLYFFAMYSRVTGSFHDRYEPNATGAVVTVPIRRRSPGTGPSSSSAYGASARSPMSLGEDDHGTGSVQELVQVPQTRPAEPDLDLTRHLEPQPAHSAPGPVIVHEPMQVPGHTPAHAPIHEPAFAFPEQASGHELEPPRFGNAPAGTGWAGARWARSWGLDYDPHPGTAYDALLTAGNGSLRADGHDLQDPDAVRQALGPRIGQTEPPADAWSAVADHLGASVLILHGDGTMSSHGQGPALVLTDTGHEDPAQRWVGMPPSTEDSALHGLSAPQIHRVASEGARFAGPRGGFFDVLSSAGRASGVPELAHEPQVLRGQLVRYMRTGLSDEKWSEILGQAGIPGPHDAAAQQKVIANVQRGDGDESMHLLLPLLAGQHFGVGIQVVHTDGSAHTHGEPDAKPAITMVPAGSHDDAWFSVAQVRPPLTAGAATRPADVAGGLGWADPVVPVTSAPRHVGPEPSQAQENWAYDHGRQLVEIPPGPNARYEAILRAAGGGFTVKGEYVSDPVRLRDLIADEVKPAFEQDPGLASVAYTFYAAHTASGDTLIDSGVAQAHIIESLRTPGFRPDLADELAPYLANRLGLGVRTVDPSGVVGRYGNGRPAYVTWTTDAGGRRHWNAAPSDASPYALGSPLRTLNQSDPAHFLLTTAIEARKNALRADGNDPDEDRVLDLLRAAQNGWLEHGPAPRSTEDGPHTEAWRPDNLETIAARLTQSARSALGGTGAVHDPALGSGLHAGMAVALVNRLFPQGIGHEPPTTEPQGHEPVTGLPADQWIIASLPDLMGALPHGAAALLLGGDRSFVVVDTPEGHRLVDFGADRTGGPITGRVAIPTSANTGAKEGLALVVDGDGHPLSADHLYDTLGSEFDSAAGWNFGPGFKQAAPETGAPQGVSDHQAAWAQDHGAGYTKVEPGPNAVFDAALKASGGVLRAHGQDVTDPTRLRQVLAEHLRQQTAAPHTLRDFPSVHAAFSAEGADRIIDEFFGQNPGGANARAVHQQLEEHIGSGKAAQYVAEAMAEPGFWEHVTQPIALDVLADWAGVGVLAVDPRGQIRLHGDPDAPRIALARLAAAHTDLPDWVALTPEHAGEGLGASARPFDDVDIHTTTSLAVPITHEPEVSPDTHAVTGPESVYHAVLDAAGGAIQIDRDTLVTTPEELKQQLTRFLLDRPDLLGPSARASIERDTDIEANASVEELIDALADPAGHDAEVVTRHLIGSYLGRELNVVDADGARTAYGSGRPITITSTSDDHGETRWTALPLESHTLDLAPAHDEDLAHGLGQDHGPGVQAERVAQTQWAPETHTLKAPDDAQTEDPWRSATFCVELEVDGQMQRACVSVAVLTLDAALAAELGVTMR